MPGIMIVVWTIVGMIGIVGTRGILIAVMIEIVVWMLTVLVWMIGIVIFLREEVLVRGQELGLVDVRVPHAPALVG